MQKVLIVDDDKELLEAVKRVLEDNDFDVHCSDCAEKAVGMVKEEEYKFILVDYKMPEKDGIWFMENADIGRGTKVLLITAYIDRDVIRKMFALGVAGYLIKPFSHEELVKHLEFHSN